ncbi:uncharacterized protein LOC133033153 isoform X2 [Cannabis sativa]|uniref:uncharacterized protein LOC133033153 isoform X2 n=1 Tax=Cannabis sativa TaxID=3483 RepID=UPI0029CA398F|nr:uncharacterized protein LOC133033153 isoform X2 [Cannabis sativa]
MAVELQQSDSCCLQSSQYIGEISALSLLLFPHRLSSLPYLLAGSGSQLLVYDLELGNMVNSFDVFHGIRVHGISSSNIHSSKIAIFCEKRVKLYSLGLAQLGLDLTLLQSLPKFGSWVLDVCFLKGHWSSSQEQEANSHLVVGCSDNSVLLWDMSNSSVVLHVQSPGNAHQDDIWQRCIG